MNGTRSLSHLTGRKFMRAERGFLSGPSSNLLGIAGFDGKLKFLNPAWEQILGYSPQELLDRPLRELIQHHGHAAAVALVDRLLAEDSFDPMEFGLRCQDGTCKWFIWHRRFDSEHQAIFIAGFDITEQKSREIASILRAYELSANAGRCPAAC
jgi:PAS domain S-box-containing protein